MKVHSRCHLRDLTHTKVKCGKLYTAVKHTGYHHEVTCKTCLRAELKQIQWNLNFLNILKAEVLERINKI